MKDGLPEEQSSPGGKFSFDRIIVAPDRSGEVETGGGGKGLLRSRGDLGDDEVRDRVDIGVPGGVRRMDSCALVDESE